MPEGAVSVKVGAEVGPPVVGNDPRESSVLLSESKGHPGARMTSHRATSSSIMRDSVHRCRTEAEGRQVTYFS